MKNLEPEDLKLRTLLRDCRSAPALPPGFQNSVWQRLEKADANAPVSWLDAIANWLLVPRLALATVTAAVMLGAIVGSVHSSSNALEIERARYVASVSPSPLQQIMRRSLVIILLALGAGAGIFLASYLVTTRLCVAHMQNSGDDLEWLRTEFHLSDAEMVTVHQLHEGYLPKCHDMCRQIAAKKSELDALLNGNTNLSAVAEAKIAEIAQLRAQCQAQMLRHFFEVSQAMPAEQGQRYLAEMRSLTLKSHELVEQNMSGTDGQANGHHHH